MKWRLVALLESSSGGAHHLAKAVMRLNWPAPSETAISSKYLPSAALLLPPETIVAGHGGGVMLSGVF